MTELILIMVQVIHLNRKMYFKQLSQQQQHLTMYFAIKRQNDVQKLKSANHFIYMNLSKELIHNK